MVKAWITSDTVPATTRCRLLQVPDDDILLANVVGALLPLNYADNWEQIGTATPAECAAAMQVMFDAFVLSICRGRYMPELYVYRDQRSNGTNGGTLTAGSNTQLPYQTVVYQDPEANVSLSANSIFLQPGLYLVQFSHVLYQCGNVLLFISYGVAPSFVDKSLSSLALGTTLIALAHGSMILDVGVVTEVGVFVNCSSTKSNTGMGAAVSRNSLPEAYGEIVVMRLGD